MGLENFTSDGTTSSTESQNNKKENLDPFKEVTDDRGRKKVFRTEKEWKETASFIEEEIGMAIEDVMNEKPSVRHDILHQAMLKDTDSSSGEFYPTKTCLVCGQTFSFPNNWNFSMIEGEVVCQTHCIGETMNEIRKANASSIQ